MNDVVFECSNGDPKYPYIYRGLVMDNSDPEQYGRVRVKIYPMYRGFDTVDIPWSKPAFTLFTGAGDGAGSFCVPKVGTFVFVMFEQGDIYQPVYFAEAPTAQKGLPTSRTTNYPNRKVWSSDKIEVIIDDSNGDVIIEHSSGSKVTMDSLGTVEVEATKIVLKSSNVNLGDELGDYLVKVSDITLGKVLAASPGSPVTWLPVVPHGTTKVKGS